MKTSKSNEQKPLIMIIGMGDLSNRLLNLLLQNPMTNRLVLAGRNQEAIRRRANLALFAAKNIGMTGSADAVKIDLEDIPTTAEIISQIRPDITFMAASLQSWRIITQLPKEVFEELDQAQFGPWLPMHLALNYKLMQAVKLSGINTKVVNAAFPDAVGPVLDKVGLAPTIGIGNVANIVPGLSYGFSHLTGFNVADIEIRLVAQHYFSHYAPRFGDAGNGSYHLTATVEGREIGENINHNDVFALLNGPFKRIGGIEGQLLTASSAARVLVAMASDSNILAHAPAPGGLPGGYPVRVGKAGGKVDLDKSINLSDAIKLNEACQRADGIENIDEYGTVTFTELEMSIMKRMIGYECKSMKLEDCDKWANELHLKYQNFADKYLARNDNHGRNYSLARAG